MGKKMREKVIGVLGGMGPYATVHFNKRFLDLTPTEMDNQYFRTIGLNTPRYSIFVQ